MYNVRLPRLDSAEYTVNESFEHSCDLVVFCVSWNSLILIFSDSCA